MASSMTSSSSSLAPSSLCNRRFANRSASPNGTRTSFLISPKKKKTMTFTVSAKSGGDNALEYRKLGDSDLYISEITYGTMTFGEQNTEKEAHELLSYAFDRGINALDTAEAYPIPMKKETQGKTDLYIASWLKTQPRDKVIVATKVCGYSERSSYLRDNASVLRVDAANIKESVEKSLKRLNTDYIDLLQIHWPDRYVPLFGDFFYDPTKWRPSVPFIEQLRAFQELIDEGKVRYIGVSNETSYGVMEFVHAAKVEGLPKIVSIQNSYSLLVRCKFEVDLVEVCHPNNCNVGLLCYSPLGGGSLSGKYMDIDSDAAKRGRFNLFPGYMERYNKSISKMTFGEQNTEKEAHELLSYAFDRGINALDTAEAYPIPMKKETQGKTDLYIASWLKTQPRDKVIVATKVCGYSERSSYLRDNASVLRVDAANIKESVEKSLKRLNTDYIDLLQIHWPDRYVPLFGDFFYDPTKWRPSVPFIEQLRAFQELIDEGKVRYIGVSNETSYGVMEFVHAAKVEGLPKIVSIQNSYSLLVRCKFEVDLVEVCHPNNCNVGLLCYSPLGGGSLSGKYMDIDSDAAKRGRFNLFPGYMERYNKSISKEATLQYIEVAKKHGLSLVELALGFARDRPFMTSSIIGATSVDQLKEDIDAFLTTERPLPPEVMADIESVFKRYKDPAIL